MVGFNFDNSFFNYLAAVVASFFLLWLSEFGSIADNEFFSALFFYVGAIGMALFSFVIIFLSLFNLFSRQ
ncbi:hypothetical protein [Halobacillus sp. K22]|uniref:hypothetical protein n=1 Tax=Halobacillus sp. K22 TaxID=3457431 RepID=UPI003FCEA550